MVFEVVVKFWVKRLIFLLSIVLSSNAFADNRVALVIGNSSYTHLPGLSNPLNDAKYIAETLERKGFSVALGVDQGHKQMLRKIADFESSLNSAEVGLFYYAGHGVQIKGTNYLIPVDAEVEAEFLIPSEAVAVDAVLAALERSSNKMNVIILDACRNNPFPAGSRSLSRGLARVSAPAGSIVAYATSPGSVAQDGVGSNSPYTRELVSAIEQPGLKIEEMFKKVRVSVSEETNGQQVPWEESSLTGDFYFSAPVAAKAQQAVAKDENVKPYEVAYWEAVKGSSDSQSYKAYLHKYPDGEFSQLAELELAKLKGQVEHGSNPATAESSTEALDWCARLLEDNQLTTGKDGNAFACFKSLLDDPNNSYEALVGISSIEQKYVQWASNAIGRQQYDKARSYIDKIAYVNPNSEALPSLRSSVDGKEGNAYTDDVTKLLMRKRRKSSINGHYRN